MHNKEHFSCRGVQLIQRLLLFALTGGILLLLVEIRFEHSAVMGEKWQSWIPCIYLPVLLLLIPIAMVFFRKFGQKMLIVMFSGLMAVGLLGFWFHSKGKPIAKVWHVIATDLEQPGHVKVSEDEEDTTPPVLAPLALMGLGSIGILVCLLASKEMNSKINNASGTLSRSETNDKADL
ncbi:MAG: hypothetical protein K2X77_10670 [Candidatus Obscuribacterales bacterium]|jgi:hypothetical protein|nr:hypothetical protein [Candidatus Obscuribacterales bacterium]